MIQVIGLSKTYGRNLPIVLDKISFEVPSGSTLSITGPSGCGKTTLLYILGGLLSLTGGSVSIDGEDVIGPGKQTSMIFQDFGLLPWKTAMENAALGLGIRRVQKGRRLQIVDHLFDDLGISGLKHSYPVQLSGGEKQRVAIARSLAVEPKVLLMDEPFSALDAMTREKLQDIIIAAWKEKNFMMVLVTHSIEEAVFLGRRIMVLSKGPAKIQQMIDNPGFGASDYRLQDSYFNVVKEVRSVVNSLNAG